MLDVAVIGCGVIGAATAYTLSQYGLNIAVFERENDVSTGTSRANTAIVHSGYDPEPGTLMAELNVRGAALTRQIAKKLNVAYKECGSLVVAFSQEELETLLELYQRGIENGVEKLEILDRNQLRALEPELSEAALGALYAPTAGIISPWEYTLAMAETAVRNGVTLHLSCEVQGINRLPSGGFVLQTSCGKFEARYIVNAAGLYADVVHNMVAKPAFSTKPIRGEYYVLDKSEGSRASHTIFPCPSSEGKGILVTPTVHGNLLIGPNAHSVARPDDDATSGQGLQAVAAGAKKLIPSINLRQSIRNYAGIRAHTDHPDFIIEQAQDVPGFIDLAGIKSPGLTAAPAIAQETVALLQGAGLTLSPKQDFIDSRTQVRFHTLSAAEKAALIAKNPAYGRVVCRCETITEGEILDALHSPIPPRSVDGVKRRCNAGMGRCQGGFCGPRVVEILARELGVSPTDIPKDTAGKYILTGETKVGGNSHV